MSAAFNHGMKTAAQDEGDAPGGKTEWEDALIRHGIKAAPPKAGPTDDELHDAAREVIAIGKTLKFEASTLAELDALEDKKGSDGDAIAAIRAKRIAEMKAAAAANKYGSVPQLTEKEFVPEVSKAPEDTFVVVLLFIHSKPECQLLSALLPKVAAKFKAVKFVRMLATECIHNYPDSKSPTIIVYKKGALLHTEVGLDAYGGLKMTADSLEWALAAWGVVKTELQENPLAPKALNSVKINFVNGRSKPKAQKPLDSDEDDGGDDDDK